MSRERKYETPVGKFIVNTYGAMFSLAPGFSKEQWWQLAQSTTFEKKGLKGLKKDGQILLYPIFNEIGIVPGAGKIYLVTGERYSVLVEKGENLIDRWYLKDSHFIFRDGKMGWEKNGRVVVPPIYDEAYEWGLGLYRVKKGNQVKYIDAVGEEKLTFRRKLLYEYTEPFWLRANVHEAMTIIECPPMPDLPQCNVWNYEGVKVGIYRANTVDIVEELINPNDELPFTKEKLKNFTNEFAYEFSAYRFTVSTENAIDELFELMGKLNVGSNSWYYVMRFTTATGEKIQASQLCMLPQKMLGLRNGTIACEYAIGTDAKQAPATMSVFVITHYQEICFPPRIYFDFNDVAESRTFKQLKEKEQDLLTFTEQSVMDEFRNDFLEECYGNALCNAEYSPERDWEETKTILDYLSQKTDVYQTRVGSAVDKIISACKHKSGIPYAEFYYNYLGWLIGKGARINAVSCGKTSLDCLNVAIQDRKRGNKKTLEKSRELLIANGAMTYAELREKFEQAGGLYDFALYLLGKEVTTTCSTLNDREK